MRRSTVVLLAVLTGMMSGFVLFRLWRHVPDPTGSGRDFGLDLIAYQSAASRLVETGSPYHPALLAGPIVNTGANVSIAYYYPPPLAQLFVPLRDVDHYVLSIVWALAQIAVLIWLVPTLYRRAGGTLTKGAVVALVLLCVVSWPLNLALYIGNVSGWIAIGIGLMFFVRPRAGGWIATTMAFIKLTPIVFLAAARVDRRTARHALIASVAIFGISFLLAPTAWVDWLRVLPNILRIAPADGFGNLAPGTVLGRFGLAGVGTAMAYVLALLFGATALWTARRDGLASQTIAAASFSMLFLSGTLWDHYLAVMIPLIIWAWPSADRRRKAVILAYSVWGVTDWIGGIGPNEGRVVSVVLLLLLVFELGLRRWPHGPEPTANETLGGVQSVAAGLPA